MESHEIEFRLNRLEKRMDKIEAKEEETDKTLHELDKAQSLIIQKLDFKTRYTKELIEDLINKLIASKIITKNQKSQKYPLQSNFCDFVATFTNLGDVKIPQLRYRGQPRHHLCE